MILLTAQPLDAGALAAAVEHPEHGGACTFVGTTRREADDREVTALDYEAYDELALAEMSRIAEEASARFGATMAIAHRVGRVAVGEPSVIVSASAGHRSAAFAACRYGIDELKARAPIWKREVHADGGADWIDGRPVPETRPA